MCRAAIRRIAILIVAAALASTPQDPSFGQQGEADLLRQIKSDLFDRKWDAALAACDEFISAFPGSPDLSRAVYYRAKAVEHIKGREAEAIEAYGRFIEEFPGATGTLREDALLSRLTLATSLWLRGEKDHVRLIMEGMQQTGYQRLYAAIQASKIDHKPASAKALPILKECATKEADDELKNECVVAVLKIDPKALEGVEPPAAGASASPGATESEVKLIRIEVFDKTKDKVVVRVNMPIAFAELILDAVQQVWAEEIKTHLEAKGFGNLENFWKAIKEGGPQTILEVDNDEERIRLWVE